MLLIPQFTNEGYILKQKQLRKVIAKLEADEPEFLVPSNVKVHTLPTMYHRRWLHGWPGEESLLLGKFLFTEAHVLNYVCVFKIDSYPLAGSNAGILI